MSGESPAAPRRADETADAQRAPRDERSNPFSTRFIRPGAIGYLFPPGVEAASLVDRLRSAGGRGAIVGPHGSGKSTLLAALVPALASAGRAAALIELHNGEGTLARHRALLERAAPSNVLIVDGYEQLWWWERFRLRHHCRRRGCWLLVTSHRATALPTIFTTQVDAPTAHAVLASLAPEGCSVTAQDLSLALARHGQNLREALFDLYDLYELRRR